MCRSVGDLSWSVTRQNQCEHEILFLAKNVLGKLFLADDHNSTLSWFYHRLNFCKISVFCWQLIHLRVQTQHVKGNTYSWKTPRQGNPPHNSVVTLFLMDFLKVIEFTNCYFMKKTELFITGCPCQIVWNYLINKRYFYIYLLRSFRFLLVTKLSIQGVSCWTF